MNAPVWVLRDTVLALHEQVIGRFGGAPGLRDAGLLDATLAPPPQLFNYGTPTLFELAASHDYGLAMNHALIDGNRRTAFTVAVLFLELNGCRFAATEADATVRMLAPAAGEMSEPELAAWLERSSRR